MGEYLDKFLEKAQKLNRNNSMWMMVKDRFINLDQCSEIWVDGKEIIFFMTAEHACNKYIKFNSNDEAQKNFESLMDRITLSQK